MSDDKDYGPYLARVIGHCKAEGDCLLWQGFMHHGTVPVAHGPGDGRQQPIRRVIWVAMGKKIIKGRHLKTSCGHDNCIAPEHAVQQQPTGGGRGVKKSPLARARLAAGRRSWAKLSPDVVAALRASDRSEEELALEHGCHPKHIGRVMRGEYWAPPAATPFTGLTR